VPVDAGRADAEALLPDAFRTRDAAISDARVFADTSLDAILVDAPTDAGVPGSEATSFSIDPAHDNCQPADAIMSPLAPLWTATFGGHVSFPLVVDGMVIVAADESEPNVRALDLQTGALVWGPIAFTFAVTLAYDRGTVFALDHSGNMAALDVTTGEQVWIEAVPNPAEEIYFYAPPVASGGLVFVNSFEMGGSSLAIDEVAGGLVWAHDTFDGSWGSVAVSDNTVYESEEVNRVAAWNAQTGEQVWEHLGNGDGCCGEAPSVYDSEIWDHDIHFGSLIFENGSGATVGNFVSDTLPAFHAGTAFYESKGTVSAVDIATNAVLWSFTGDGQLCTAPVVAGRGGQVLVGSQSGNVYEIDEATGIQRSVSTAGAGITCFSETDSMALAENHLVVPVGNDLVVF
jgi:outer membrane protein assembly factor BamB